MGGIRFRDQIRGLLAAGLRGSGKLGLQYSLP